MKIKFFAQNADFGKSVDEWHYNDEITEVFIGVVAFLWRTFESSKYTDG
jgi:hypothetical protein